MRMPPARPSGRVHDEMRRIVLEPDFSKYAEGSCLARFGDTHVLCTATVEDRVPPFLRNSGRGWVTAEYGMLPRSTNTRTDREAAVGRQSGRTQEIQRLIGRSLRSITDLTGFGERQVRVRAVRPRGTAILDAIEDAYAAKYTTAASRKYVRGFRTPRRRAATMEFQPRS